MEKDKERYNYPRITYFIPSIKRNNKVRSAKIGEKFKFEDIVGLIREGGFIGQLETDFKRKYPYRKNYKDFYFVWTDNFSNLKILEWLNNDAERVEALNEMKAEIEHRLPPKHPKKADYLKLVDWKIEQILDLQASAKTGATTLPDGLNTPEVRNLLNKAIEAGYLNDNYQPIGILLNENKTPNYAYLTAFVNAFNEVYFKPKRQRPHWSDFQKLWDIKQDLASRNSQYDGGNSTKFSINFEELKSELVKLWRNS